jgi:biopolymer transport protein ExbD
MITRPLDLAARLRPPPRNFDWLFLVVGGLIVVFFSLFGSRFVLAPGLGVDFRLATLPGALTGAATTTHVVTIKSGGFKNGGFVFAENGALNVKQFGDWLKAAAKTTKVPVLLVQAGADVPMADLTDILTISQEAGFARVQFAADRPAAPPAGSALAP